MVIAERYLNKTQGGSPEEQKIAALLNDPEVMVEIRATDKNVETAISDGRSAAYPGGYWVMELNLARRPVLARSSAEELSSVGGPECVFAHEMGHAAEHAFPSGAPLSRAEEQLLVIEKYEDPCHEAYGEPLRVENPVEMITVPVDWNNP